jgi:hypothetical protein
MDTDLIVSFSNKYFLWMGGWIALNMASVFFLGKKLRALRYVWQQQKLKNLNALHKVKSILIIGITIWYMEIILRVQILQSYFKIWYSKNPTSIPSNVLPSNGQADIRI